MFLLFTSFVSIGCNNKKDADGVNVDASPVLEYPVVTVTPRTTTLYFDYPATIQGQQNIEIRPKIDGYIESIHVDEGATVKKGQLLFRISAPQFEQELRTATANVKIAQAEVSGAQMQVNKVRPLVEKGIISSYELESANYALEANRAALAQAEATLANARTNVGYTSITSPVDGVAGTIPYKIGSLVSSNTPQPLITISNIENIYAYMSVSESRSLNFSSRTKGATIEERLATLPPATLMLANGAEFPYKGRIQTESGLVNTGTGSVTVRAIFPNPEGLVRSGSSGTVRLPRTIDTALLVPQKATYELQDKRFVYVVEDSGKVRSAEIKILDNSDGQFYVVLDGLRSGDAIVVEGIANLRDGDAIKPKQIDADSLFHQADLIASDGDEPK